MADIRPPITSSNIPTSWSKVDQFIVALTAVDQAETPFDTPVGVKATYLTFDGTDPDHTSPKQETTPVLTFTSYWTVSGQGNIPIKYFSVDQNLNIEIFKTEILKLDNIAPVTQVVVVDPDGSDNWYIINPTISLVATDTGSGVNKTYYKWDAAPSFSEYSAPLSIPSEGVHTLYYYSDDIAGNVESVKTKAFKLDSVSPLTEDDAPEGLQKQPVTVHFFYADNASGVMQTYYTLDGSTPTISSPSGSSVTISETGTYTLKYRSIDYAGNLEAVKQSAVEIEIDTESPFTYVSETGGIWGTHGWWNLTPAISLSATDPSGIKDIYYKLYEIGATTTAKYTSPINLSTTINLSVNYNISLEIDQSGLRVDIDLRGVIPSQTTIVEIINAINTAVGEVIATETNAQGETGTGHLTLTSIKAGQSDSTAEIKFIQPLVRDATPAVFSLGVPYPHTYTETVLFVTYTGSFTLPNDGQWKLEYYAEDNEGNEGSVASKQYKLDSVAPVTTVQESFPPDGSGGWYLTNPFITLTAVDTTSGIYRIFYQWDDEQIFIYGTAFQILSAGTHVLKYWSVDYAGVIESTNLKTYYLDSITGPPITTDNTLNFTGIILTNEANGYTFVEDETPIYVGAWQVQANIDNVKAVTRFSVVGNGPFTVVSIGGANFNLITVTGPSPLTPTDVIKIDYYYDHSSEPAPLNTNDFTLVEHTPVYIHDHDITVTLFPHAVYSPVAHTYYSVNGSPYVEGTQVLLPPVGFDSGDFTITYYSVTASGVAETPHAASFIVRIDKRLPVVALTKDVPEGLDTPDHEWHLSNFKVFANLESSCSIQRLNRTILPITNYRVFTAENDMIVTDLGTAYLSSIEIVTGVNDKLDIRTNLGTTPVTILQAKYNADEFLTALNVLLAPLSITATFVPLTKKYTLTGVGPFDILLATGPSFVGNTICDVLGFYKEDRAEFSFTTSGITSLPAVGDQYSNNSSTFYIDFVSPTLIRAHRLTGTTEPLAAGNLIRVIGAGDTSIAFTACTSTYVSDFGVKTNLNYADIDIDFIPELQARLVVVDGSFVVTRIPPLALSYTYKFLIKNLSVDFELQFGTNPFRSAATLLGFDQSDTGVAASHQSDYYRLKLQDKFVKSVEAITGGSLTYVDDQRDRGGSGFYDEILVAGTLPALITEISVDYFHFVGIKTVDFYNLDNPAVVNTTVDILHDPATDADIKNFDGYDDLLNPTKILFSISSLSTSLTSPIVYYLVDGNHLLGLYAKAYDWNTILTTGIPQKTSRQAQLPFKLDRVIPSTTDDTPVSSSTAWLAAPLTITFTVTDTASGPKEIHYTLDGSVPTILSPVATQVSPTEFEITEITSGTPFSLRYFAIDIAGNQETPTAVKEIYLDASIPVTTLTTVPAAPDGTNNWYKTQPDVLLTAVDAESNIQKTLYRFSETFVFSVSDIVLYPSIGDRYSNNSSIFRVDAFTLTTIQATRISGTNNPSKLGLLVRVLGSGDLNITFSSQIPIASGTWIEFDPIFTFTVSAPIGTLPSVGDHYSNNSSTFRIYSADASEIKAIRISGTNNPSAFGMLHREVGSGDVDISFSSRTVPYPLTISSPLINGITIIQYHSRDNVGNVEPINTITIKVDSLAPTTITDIPATPYSSQKRVNFIVSDIYSSFTVPATYFSINAGPLNNAAFVDFSSSGTYTIDFYSVDNAGNVEATNTQILQLDIDPPTISNLQPPGCVIILATTQITFDVADADAGVDINSVVFDVDGVEFSTTKNSSSFSYVGSPALYSITISPVQNVLTFADIKLLKIRAVDLAGLIGNAIYPPFEISFIPADTQAPRIRELFPLPNATDVSTKSNVVAYLVDTESGVDINSVVVNVNAKDYRIVTHDVLSVRYTGTAVDARLSITGSLLQTHLDGVLDIDLSLNDADYSTVKKVCDYIDSLTDYECSIVNTQYTQYASYDLLQVTNLDIKASAGTLKLYLPEDNLNFSFMQKEDGYIVFANPAYEFDNKIPVNVSINATDNDGNELISFNYIFIPNRLATLSITKRNYLNEKALVYIKDIQDYIASCYTRSRSTEFYGHHKSIGLELARVEEEFDHVNEDADFDLVRPEYLYEKFGYLMEIEPTKDLSIQEYRDQLFSMRDIYLAGSLLSSLQAGIAIFTKQDVVIYELYKLFPNDLSKQFIIRVDILLGDSRVLNFDLEALNENLIMMFNQVKPAHVYLLHGFVWYDFFTRPTDLLAGLKLDGRIDGWTHDILTTPVADEESYIITNHLSDTFSAEDVFILNASANLQITSAPELFALTDGAQLGISIDHAAINWVTFNAVDFVDISNATAAEVAVVLNAVWEGIHHLGIYVEAVGGIVILHSSHSFQIFDGIQNPNFQLQFPTSYFPVTVPVSILNDKNYVLFPANTSNIIEDQLISMSLAYLDFYDTWDLGLEYQDTWDLGYEYQDIW